MCLDPVKNKRSFSLNLGFNASAGLTDNGYFSCAVEQTYIMAFLVEEFVLLLLVCIYNGNVIYNGNIILMGT